MRYEINDIDALGRIGSIKVKEKKILTPNLIPVVHPYENLIKPKKIQDIGFDLIFTNAYILYKQLSLRNQVLKSGLHEYLNYEGLIATDSGAFQMYMYQDSELDIDPETIEKFQEEIKSDFPVILDLPVQLNDDYETAKSKVFETIRRSKNNIERRIEKNCHWIGPIHGGRYKDLLRISATEMSKLDFDIYALGGLVKAFLEYRFKDTIEMMIQVKKHTVSNKPIHMFGLGLPQFFSLAVACGCDLMDSAAYILYAKEERYFDLSTGTKMLNELTEFPCNCPICSKFTPSDLKSLPKEEKTKLLAKHNLYLSLVELKTIRQAIKEGNLWELVEQRVKNHPRLVRALSNLKQHVDFFEKYEKRYKDHGRLFSSLESLNRPLNFRFKNFIKTKYRKPAEAKHLVILPELDEGLPNSPSLREWISVINNQKTIKREKIDIGFFSEVFGIIPEELIDTYPLGQYEARKYGKLSELNSNRSELSDIINRNEYETIQFLNPENFVNHYGEVSEYLNKKILKEYILNQKSKYSIPIKCFSKISNLLDNLIKTESNDN